jgi:hypothetical protein
LRGWLVNTSNDEPRPRRGPDCPEAGAIDARVSCDVAESLKQGTVDASAHHVDTAVLDGQKEELAQAPRQEGEHHEE